jgi:hypothetical protein
MGGFRVQPLSVSYGVSECSLYTVSTEELGEYSYVTCIYQANAVNIHSSFCKGQEANPGSEELKKSALGALVQPKAKGDQ